MFQDERGVLLLSNRFCELTIQTSVYFGGVSRRGIVTLFVIVGPAVVISDKIVGWLKRQYQ